MQEGRLREIGAISRTRAAYPIIIISLCACLFGPVTFQLSFVQGTHARAGTFFSLHASTVVAGRWLLTRVVTRVHREVETELLPGITVLGIAAIFAVPYYAWFHSASAVLLGTGYGLVYPTI